MTGPTTRVWHQSLTELDRLPHYAEHLRKHAARVTGPGTTVEIHGVARGTYPDGVAPIEVLRYPAAEHLLGAQLLEAASRAEREGYDVMAVGCFFDPVLDELRSAVDIPVVALAQRSLLMASTVGDRYALLAISPANRRRLVELVEQYGFAHRVAGVVDLRPAVTEDELDAAFSDLSVVRPRLEEAVARAADDGADLVIPAENVINSLLVDASVVEIDDLPVLDAFAALLAHAEAAVALHRRTGLAPARAGRWARAPREVLDAAGARARDVLAPSPEGRRQPHEGVRLP